MTSSKILNQQRGGASSSHPCADERLSNAMTKSCGSRQRRVMGALACIGLLSAMAFLTTGCSVVRINGSLETKENALCVVAPKPINSEVHGTLLKLLGKKGFVVQELPHGAAPGRCPRTLVYTWAKEQYYLPAYVKQYAINLDLYVEGEKYANASFDPTRNLVSPHVRFVRFSRYLARVLDRLFPGRKVIGA